MGTNRVTKNSEFLIPNALRIVNGESENFVQLGFWRHRDTSIYGSAEPAGTGGSRFTL